MGAAASPDDDPVRWWLAGETAAAVAGRLDEVAAQQDQAGARSLTVGTGPARLGIVAPDDRKVRLARRLIGKGDPWRGRSDIWFTSGGLAHDDRAGGADGGRRATVGKIAFLFPGVEPVFGAEATDVPALAGRLGMAAPQIADDTIAHRSSSIYRLGIFLDGVLRRLGVQPDVLAGHSIGEWSGTVAAGILPPGQADELLASVDLDRVDLPDLDFAALAAGVAEVAPVVDELEGVAVSHDNCPNQSVICGRPELVNEALGQLRTKGVLGYKLDFQSGFHTPAVAPLVEPFRAAIGSLPLGGGDVPLWSATTVAPYPATGAEIVELHFRHLVEPVRFRPLVERLYHDAGVRVFIQAGIGSLTSFVDDTLGHHDHASVQLITPKRSALAQAHRAMTALWVEGVDVAVDALSLVPPRSVPGPLRDPLHPAQRSRYETGLTRLPGRSDNQAMSEAVDLLTAAANASRDVVEAFATRLGLPPADRLSPAIGATAAAPTAARDSTGPQTTPSHTTPPTARDSSGPGLWPSAPLKVTRHMSLETMPETLDHSLVEQPEGWPDASDGFPIVAMTTQIQVLQDIAEAHADGADVVEVFDVRNTRWLDLSDPQDVEITLTPKRHDVLGMTLGRYSRANLRVGRFPPADEPSVPPLTNPRPPEHTAREMFEQGIMFHGPRFHGITTLGPIGDNGMAGDFEQLATPGSLLDNLGKLIAYWVMEQRNWGEAALPISVDRIRFFGPNPRPGTPVRCEIRIVELQRDGVTADGVLLLPDGTLLCRVDSWTSIVFHRDELVEPFYYAPSTRYLTERQPGGWHVVVERWPTGPGRELTSRRFMSRPEREAFAAMNLLQQRRWLIDLVAAKDTVRQWLWDSYRTPSYPVEIELVPDGERRFRAKSPLIPVGHDLRITVSGANWMAVAILGDGEHYDIETRLIPDDEDPAAVARQAAAAVAARNPGAEVDQIGPVEGLTPSRLTDLGVTPQAPFAVAWTVMPTEPTP